MIEQSVQNLIQKYEEKLEIWELDNKLQEFLKTQNTFYFRDKGTFYENGRIVGE